MSLTELQQSVLGTLIYCDLLDVAPSLLELQNWLIQPTIIYSAIGQSSTEIQELTAPTLSQLAITLEKLPLVRQAQGVYYLAQRDQLPQLRRQRYDQTERNWKRIRSYVRLLARLPGVEAIWLCNSMGWNDAKPTSDNDLVIVTAPNRIWTTRWWTTMSMKLLRQRPGQQVRDRAICLSLYLNRQALNLAPYTINDHDIGFAFFATQMYPVYDPHRLYSHYQAANQSWLKNYFVSHLWNTANPVRGVGKINKLPGAGSLTRIGPESALERWQWRLFPEAIQSHIQTHRAQHQSNVIVNNRILKLHTNDNRAQIQQRWGAQLRTQLST